MLAIRILLPSLVFSLLSTGAPAAAFPQKPPGEGELIDFRSQAGAAALPGLHELALWARNHKLYAYADALYRGLLVLDPEHRGARRWLQHFRVGDRWEANLHRPVRNNRAPKAEAARLEQEYRDRLERTLGPFRDGLLLRLGDPRRSVRPETREHLLRELLLFEPNNVDLRKLVGEERWEEDWLLAESARTLRARGLIRELAQASLERVGELERGVRTRDERDSQLQLGAIFKSDHVRVTGTVSWGELSEAARTAEAVGHLFEEVFDDPGQYRRGYSVLLLRNAKQLLDLGPLVRSEEGPPNPAGSLGGWLSYREVAQWSSDRERRLDGLARQTLGAMLMDTYGLDSRNGWIWEGVGLFLVEQLVGTRRTYFMDAPGLRTSDPDLLWKTLTEDSTDWMELALERREQGRWPGLEFLVGRPIGSMTDVDLLQSYVLAAYILQGWPDHAGLLLSRIGAGEHPIHAFETVLGHSIPQLEQRMARWLEEVY